MLYLAAVATALVALAGVSLYDAPVASGMARLSLFFVAILGLVLVVYLAVRGFDRGWTSTHSGPRHLAAPGGFTSTTPARR